MKRGYVTLESIKAPDKYSFVGGPFGSDLTQKDYVDDGVPVIRGVNLTGSSRFRDEDYVFVSDSKANRLQANMAYPGDIIFTQRGTLGQVGVIPEDATYDKYIISQSQMKLKVDREIAIPTFIYYYFRHPNTVAEIKNRSISSGVPHVNLGIMKNFLVPLPAVIEQQRIVDILSTYDDVIENNKRRIALLEESARMLYREWFVNLRFPGHEHVKVIDGVPEGWRRTRLDEVAKINTSNIPMSFSGSIEYIDISSVSTGSIDHTEKIEFSGAPSRARRLLKHGDIIWSCVRPNRAAHAIVWYPDHNLVASTGFVVISPHKLPTSFVYQGITTESYVGYLSNNARGVAYPAVTASEFEKSVIIIPDGHLVEFYDNNVIPLMEHVYKLRQMNRSLSQARDLLLPRLMSGEIAV